MAIIKIKSFRGKLLELIPERYFFQTKEFIDAMENNDIPKPGKVILFKNAERRQPSYPEMLAGLKKACRERVEEIRADPFPTIEALQEEVGRMHAIIECIKSIVWPVPVSIDGIVQYTEPIDPLVEAMEKLNQIEKILINSKAPTTPET